MRSAQRVLCRLLAVFVVAGFASAAAAAEIVITTTGAPSWKSATGESDPDKGSPLVVEVAKGDTILFDLTATTVPHHGVVTIDGKGTENPSDKPSFVWSCAQPATDPSTTGAVLREMPCSGTSTIFNPPGPNKATFGKLRLQVLDNFAGDVNFWCTIHTSVMWGVIRLKP
jgi:hypothetical protein